MFERLDALLAQSSGAKVFPVRRIAPEWIEDAERELGLPLPATYRCWLQTYGNLLAATRSSRFALRSTAISRTTTSFTTPGWMR